jgi:spermidine synthase
MGVAAVATLALYDGMFDFMGWLFDVLRRGESAYLVYNLVNHALALAIMLPATFLAGMTFPLITTALLRGRDGERAIGYTYAANTLGSIVGVILAVHFALPVLGIKGGLVFGAAIDVALGIALLWWGAKGKEAKPLVAWGATAVAALAIVTVAVPVLPERMASGVYRHGRAKLESNRSIDFARDGKTSSITIIRAPSSLAITTNGKPDASISTNPAQPLPDEVTMVMTGLVPLAFKPDARTAAIIGFGSGMTTTTLLGSPNLERVDTIEIEPQMVEGARLFGDIVAPAYADPRSRIVIDDAKSYFARSRLRYDLIVSEPSNPWVSGVASLFTQEFYTRVKRQLNPGGLFVQWIQVYEFNDRLLAMILRALDAEFDDYAVYAANDGDLVIVASPTRLPESPSGAFATWPGMRPLLERVRLASLDEVEGRRIAGKRLIRPLLTVFGDGINSDFYPLVDQDAPKARFAGEMASGLMRTSIAGVPIAEMLTDTPVRELSPVGNPISPPLRLTMLQSAQGSASFLLTGTSASGLLPRDIGLLRAIVWDCASTPPRVRVPELMLDVAEVVNPNLPRERAVAVWQAMRSARCASRLDTNALEWLALFEAVAERNAARMAPLGLELARSDASPGLRSYAAMAAMTGLIASGRNGEAQRFLAAVAGSLPEAVQREPALRLLSVLAQGGIAQQAAAR